MTQARSSKPDVNNVNYVNSWENVKAYVEFVLSSPAHEGLRKSFNNDVVKKDDQSVAGAAVDQEKIKATLQWLDQHNSSYPWVKKIKSFIKNQIQQSEASKLSTFFIQNSYSKINKEIRKSFLGNIKKVFNNEDLGEETKKEIVKNHFNNNAAHYSKYARFSQSIRNLSLGNLSLSNFSLFDRVGVNSTQEYHTSYDWKAMQAAIEMTVKNSMTDQKDRLHRIYRRIMKITLSGASDQVKSDSLWYFMNDSIKETRNYERLNATLKELKSILWATNQQDGKYQLNIIFTCNNNKPKNRNSLNK